MKFENAVALIKEGKVIKNKTILLFYFSPVALGFSELLVEGVGKHPLKPFILKRTEGGSFIPWVPTPEDIISEEYIETDSEVTVLTTSENSDEDIEDIEAIKANIKAQLQAEFEEGIEFINSERERLQKLELELKEKEIKNVFSSGGGELFVNDENQSGGLIKEGMADDDPIIDTNKDDLLS